MIYASNATKGGPWLTKSPTPKPTRKVASGSSSSGGKWGGSSSETLKIHKCFDNVEL